MAILTLPDTGEQLTEFTAIRDYLHARGIWHDQWQASKPLAPDASQEEVLEAYDHVLKPYMAQNGYTTADVLVVHPDTPNIQELGKKFLAEHTHTEDEVRFFVEGQGLFWFNLGQNEQGEHEPVIALLCQAGDLISVPAGVKHWFDLGPTPLVKAIRLFIDTSGWVPDYTQSGIDSGYNGRVGFPELKR